MKTSQIICGDSESVLKNFSDSCIDLVVTSPPYFNAKDYIEYYSIQEYFGKMRSIFIQIERVLKKSRMCVINISPVLISRGARSKQSRRLPLPFYFVSMMEEIGFEFLEDIIWKKPEGAVPNRNGKFSQSRKPVAYKPNIVTEYILVFKKKADFLIEKILKNDSLVLGAYERTNVWEFNPETRSSHPACFPEFLSDRCIQYYSYEDDLILDPCMGSGTTGVSAKKFNRNFIGIEIEKKFCVMAEERIAVCRKPMF